MTGIVSNALIADSNRLWEVLGSEGMNQLTTLVDAHPTQIKQLRGLLTQPIVSDTLGAVGTVSAHLAPANRVAFRAVTNVHAAGAIDFGMRSARRGAGLLAKIPGPLRSQRERAAHFVDQAHQGTKMIQDNRVLISRWLQYSDENPTAMRGLLTSMQDPETKQFLQRLDTDPAFRKLMRGFCTD